MSVLRPSQSQSPTAWKQARDAEASLPTPLPLHSARAGKAELPVCAAASEAFAKRIRSVRVFDFRLAFFRFFVQCVLILFTHTFQPQSLDLFLAFLPIQLCVP